MGSSGRPFSEDLRAAGWHSRGYLPHFEGGEVAQFVTFRLKDSLPQSVVERWRRELTREDDAALRRRVEAYLDEGYGAASLKQPQVASVIQDALLYYDGARYRLAAWAVMPNHVHLLATPCGGHTLSGIMHSIKSYTAGEANKLLGLRGVFWMEDYFDRYVRSSAHYERTILYVENNPVKAKLCRTPEEWPFSSARFRGM
ncbi:MAG TPA: transposase [Pyrinomonadaceae bacterium]|nr:transposase [Pyrinomonadaceae bacterium]